MDNEEIDSYKPPKPRKKVLQVPVIVGWGEKQELVVKVSTVSPPSPPVFRIKDIDKTVEITNVLIVPPTCKTGDKWHGKVILDGFIDKNVNYKTITDYEPDAVNGPLYHFTTRIEFATFVDVVADEPFSEDDNAEILEAYVEGEKEELLDPNPLADGAPDWAVTYNRLLEKIIVKIKLKITKIEHVPVAVDP
ncbi:protein of unknown function [Clostridium acidisoli DSM 12555]|jgi:hypothetical protein|uniref:SipL SPOCS domain-containing protein n=1 Tax=Clostridium acidisoli DSM 12555 TaxID=1121291 RepID=A0A1W1X732_9CLOT|nr:SPOCS domain-containing protein [Clostridium acidisoli]SMC19633.1 protein of unknown function [Clostridium acidisoli DSM 12555]